MSHVDAMGSLEEQMVELLHWGGWGVDCPSGTAAIAWRRSNELESSL